MTTQEVANRLVELCRQGMHEEAVYELYSPEIISIEPDGTPNSRVQGFEAIKQKGEAWKEMIETVHSSEISDPLVAENHFTATMKSDVTFKGAPEKITMEEVCVYQVADGKVVYEQFFWTPRPVPEMAEQ